MSGCSELLAFLCTAPSAALVSQDPQYEVLSLTEPRVSVDPQGMEELSAPCAPSWPAVLWAWGIYLCDEWNISVRIWVRELLSLCLSLLCIAAC